MILCCGEALIDFIPTVAAASTRGANAAECYTPAVGGSPFNTAVAVARLGAPAGFLSRVSRDLFGDQIMEAMNRNSVATTYVARGEQPTTLAFVRRNEQGEARYAFFANGSADRSLSADDTPADLPASVSCLAFGSISLLLEPGATTISQFVLREAGRRVLSFDPNIRANLISDRPAYMQRFLSLAAHATIVKVSDDDLQWLYPDLPLEEAARSLVQAGTALVVVTCGASGSLAFSSNLHVGVPAPVTKVADTVGAGDSFHGGLLAWLHDHDLLSLAAVSQLDKRQAKAALTFAAQVAAVTCSRPGADPAYRSELPAELQ